MSVDPSSAPEAGSPAAAPKVSQSKNIDPAGTVLGAMRPVIELVVGLGLSLVLLLVVFELHIYDSLLQLAGIQAVRTAWDEIVVGAAVLITVFAVFSVRRWQEARAEINLRTTTQTALADSEQRYRALFENMPAGYAYCRMIYGARTEFDDFEFVEVNQACLALTGQSSLQGRRVSEIFPTLHTSNPDLFEFFKRVSHGSRSERSEFYFRPGNVWLSIVAYASQPGYFVAVLDDISERKRAEQELSEREAYFRALIHNSSDIITVVDENTIIQYLSPSVEPLLGYKPEELIGKSSLELLHPDDLPQISEMVIRFMSQSGVSSRVETRYHHKDGSWRYVEGVSHSFTDRNGTVSIVINSRDITERKELEARQQLQIAALEAVGNGIVITHRDGSIVWVNRAFTQLTGYAADEVVGRHTRIFNSGKQSREYYQDLWDTILSDRVWHGELINRRKDGSLYNEESTITPVRAQGKGITHFVAVKQDVSERKRIEAEIQQANRDLEQRVSERTATLSEVNAELRRAARVKDDFLASMSHELRTPLNGILALTESLQEGTYGPLEGRQLKPLSLVIDSGHHLLRLINDVLDLAKIESGKIELHKEISRVESICLASLDLVRQIAERKHLQLSYSHVQPDISLRADPRALRQILVNLLGNAVKFTPAGGRIGLDVQCDAPSDTIHFVVWDTGIGIAAEDSARIFQPFVQADSGLSRQYEGTGLGLALVYRLTTLHAGSIALTSAPGQGSRFTVSLPWEAETRKHTSAPESELTLAAGDESQARRKLSAEGRRVLLADDNENIRTVYADYLIEKGYSVFIAADGENALVQAEQNLPDLILMDIQMPRLDGLAVIQRLRAKPEFRETPIIALTALVMPGDRERCLEAGANLYLAKPVGLTSLMAAIDSFLQGSADT